MLSIKNLKVALYDSKLGKEKIILEDVNLELNRGEIVKLSGFNGAGKSSLLNAIFKIKNVKVAGGEVALDDKVITELKTEEIAKLGIYYAIQNVPSINGVSTLQLLYKGYKNLHPSSVLSIIDFRNNLQKKCTQYGLDFDLISGDINANLSGGEKKKAMLIHILALEPEYILLDEPDSGVDVSSVAKVYEVMEKLKEEGVGILFTSHNVASDQVKCNREYIIEDSCVRIKTNPTSLQNAK